MRTTYITAAVIAVLIALWLLSGQFVDHGPTSHPTLAERNLEQEASLEDKPLTRVRARVIHASPQTADVVIRGRTQNKRTLEVRSETSGRIVERPVERGSEVSKGDLLCRIALDDRGARLTEAEAALNQARIDYQGSLRLKKKGFQSETAIATTKARLAAAEAQVERRKLEIDYTYIRAPFKGVVENVEVEIGDVVQPGSACITLVDLDPMLLLGRVAEREVSRLKEGTVARGILIDGTQVSGAITFIGKKADPATRTYAVEVEVPNPGYDLRSGITTEIRIPVASHMAQRISPALLALDDAGNIGLRTLDAENRVEFHPVEILRDEGDGFWVTGLPDVATLITVGQELVVPGEEVDVTFEASDEMPASANPAPEAENLPAGSIPSSALEGEEEAPHVTDLPGEPKERVKVG